MQELQSNDSDLKKFLENNIDDTCRIHNMDGVNGGREECLDILRKRCIAIWLEEELMMILDNAFEILNPTNTHCIHDWVSNNSIPLTCCTLKVDGRKCH